MNKVRFGDILYIKGRIGWQSLKKEEYLDEGDYYLITGVDITDDHRINYNNCFYVSKERYEMDDKIQVKNGDIIVTKDGTIGKIALVDNLDKPATLNSHLFLIRNKKPEILDTTYLFYILRSDYFQKFASNNTTGSNIPAFTQANISDFEIDLPSIENQRKIGKFLSDIDKKIINNNFLIARLEEMSETIYDYCFIQFDFPNKDGKPYKSSGGKMVWNDILKREIPENCNVKLVSDIVNVITGKKDANFATENGKYDFFTCSNDILRCDEYEYEGKSVLIAGNGDFNVKYFEGKFNAYQRTYILTPQNEKYIGLIYQSAKKKITVFKKGSNGSIVKFITKGDIDNIELVIPNDDKVLNVLNSNLDAIQHIRNENKKLKLLRDFLLPLLMNGQVKL